MAEKQEIRQPPRPTITLPPRPSMESLAGFTYSHGHVTPVSSFFSHYFPESSPDFRCFSRPFAGAMNSPLAAMASVQSPLFASNTSDAPLTEAKSGDGAEKDSGLKQNRPMSSAVARSPLFSVPPGLIPSGLPYLPGLFSRQHNPFGISPQQVLEPVTAQAALSKSQTNFDPNSEPPTNLVPETLCPRELPSILSEDPRQIQASLRSSVPTAAITKPSYVTSSSIRNEPLLSIDEPAEDGYNWRKYGKKQLRNYYRCTHQSCPVKKVRDSLDGQITEVVYKGRHNHEMPQHSRRAKEAIGLTGKVHSHAKLEVSSRQMGNLNQIESAQTSPRRDQELSQMATVRTSGLSANDAGTGTIGDDEEPNPKRRNMEVRPLAAASSASHRTVTEPKIVVHTRSEVDLLDDGYRWLKYGQDAVKGNPHPRSYYKCTFAGCHVRKLVERPAADPKAVITTYEGRHNHSVPVLEAAAKSLPMLIQYPNKICKR